MDFDALDELPEPEPEAPGLGGEWEGLCDYHRSGRLVRLLMRLDGPSGEYLVDGGLEGAGARRNALSEVRAFREGTSVAVTFRWANRNGRSGSGSWQLRAAGNCLDGGWVQDGVAGGPWRWSCTRRTPAGTQRLAVASAEPRYGCRPRYGSSPGVVRPALAWQGGWDAEEEEEQILGSAEFVLERFRPRSLAPCVLVWLHGLGDTEASWAKLLQREVLDVLERGVPGTDTVPLPCRLVAPRAPCVPVRCNGNMLSHSWFDIARLPIEEWDYPSFGCSFEGAQAAAAQVREILCQLEAEGVPAGRVVVGGFSQGGAVALLAALGHSDPLAGCIVLSGLCLGAEDLPALVQPANARLEALWCHGERDATLPPSLQQRGCAALRAAGMQVEERQHPAAHEAHADALRVATDFLRRRLS